MPCSLEVRPCCLEKTLLLSVCLCQTETLTESVVPLYVKCEGKNQNSSACSGGGIGLQMWKSKNLLAGKRVIYSWPLAAPFQMLDHVKQSIAVTCTGAFMGLLYYSSFAFLCQRSTV